MREISKIVPIDYTLVREQKDLPLKSKIGFWDVPEWIDTLLRLPWYF